MVKKSKVYSNNKIKIKKHERIPGEKRKFLKKFFLMEEKMFLMLLKVIYF